MQLTIQQTLQLFARLGFLRGNTFLILGMLMPEGAGAWVRNAFSGDWGKLRSPTRPLYVIPNSDQDSSLLLVFARRQAVILRSAPEGSDAVLELQRLEDFQVPPDLLEILVELGIDPGDLAH